jgi:RNA polymerase sigma-70 factor (ECF subfamily)
MPYRDLSATELVRACVDSADREAWREFVRRFQPTIAGVALRTARLWGEASPHVLEDLVQETFLKLCADDRRLLREFEPRHEEAFFGYLKVVTTRVVHDFFKRTHAVKRRPSASPDPAASGDPADPADATAAARIERDALFAQIDGRLARLDLGSTAERDRRIFRLYYRAGMSARAIAELPGIELTVKGVESTIFRITRLLRAELAGGGPECPNSTTRAAGLASNTAAEKGIGGKERSQ